MAGLNKVMLIGRLGADPEARSTTNGNTVVTFNLATDESYKDKDGNRVERTEWHRVVVWDKLAEICKQYLTKGRLVYIEGKLQTRSWDDKDTGKKNYMTEIVASDMKMLDSKSDRSTANLPPAPPASEYDAPPAQLPPKASAPSPKQMSDVPASDTKNDDLPF